MSWEQRLREAVLAGGAFLVAGCHPESYGPDFCCNANTDPCCMPLACGAPMTPACACELALEGGTLSPLPDGGEVCAKPVVTVPVLIGDGGIAPGDASADADAPD